MLAVLSVLWVSPQALVALHYNYYLGNTIEKIHPATYLCSMLILMQFLSKRRAALFRTVRENPGVYLLPLGATAVAVYAGLFLAAPGTGLVDTWVLPALIFILVVQINNRERSLLRNLMSLFFVFNALVGIFEVASGRRLIPIAVASATTGDYAFPIEWRAGAFLGHPLGNAYLTGCFILLLFMDQRIKSTPLRLAAIAICSLSLLAFGSRAAMAFLVMFLGVGLAYTLARTLLTGKIAQEVLIYLYGLLFGAFLGLPLLLASGFADRFVKRFTVDNGSAAARTGAIELVQNISFRQLLSGIPHTEMVALGERFQIGDGVENFWLGFLLSFGFIGYALLMPGLFAFCRDIVRRTNKFSGFVLLFFFFCCSTSVSLSSKSTMLATVTALCLTSRHMEERRRPLSLAVASARGRFPRSRHFGSHREGGQ